MITRRIVTAGASLALLAGTARAQNAAPEENRAPFGLTWGLSQDEVRALGVTLAPAPNVRNFGVSALAANLPRVLADTDLVILSFGHRNKLWRIAASSRKFERDPAGGAVINRYRELSENLTQNYGRGQETDTRDTQVFRAPNEYIASLRSGRAFRYTTFSTPNMNIELSIRADMMDMAVWFLIFEHKPGEREFQEDKRRQERGAL